MARFFLSDDPQARHSESSAHSSRDADGPVSESRRQETSPPALFFRNQPAWRRWVSAAWQWLWDLEDDPGLEPALSPMNQVRVEFRNALWDLQSAHADHVRDQIEKARSLRELWHLRADVFKAVAMNRGQIEAQLRIDHLDDHFPVRSFKQTHSRHAHVTTW